MLASTLLLLPRATPIDVFVTGDKKLKAMIHAIKWLLKVNSKLRCELEDEIKSRLWFDLDVVTLEEFHSSLEGVHLLKLRLGS